MLSIIGFRWDRNDAIQMYIVRIVEMIYLIESRQHTRGTCNIKTWLIRGIVNQSETGKKNSLEDD